MEKILRSTFLRSSRLVIGSMAMLSASALSAFSASPAHAAIADAGPAEAWKSALTQCEEFSRAGKLDQALASAELSLSIAEKELGADERAARSLKTIAQIQLARRNVFQAEIFFERAIELYKKTKGPEDVDTANTMVQLGMLYFSLHRVPESEELLRTAYEVLRNKYGRDDPKITMAMGGLAETYKAMGDRRAIDLFKNVIRILSKRGSAEMGVVSSRLHLADIYEGIGEYDNAIECYFAVIETLEEQHGIRHWRLSSIYNNLGLVLTRARRLEEAKGAYRHSLDLLIKEYGPDHPEVQTVLENMNNLYVQNKDTDASDKIDTSENPQAR